SVDFQTVDGTATTGDTDYQSNTGTITIAPNETTKQITILVNGDTTYESDENFTVHLSNAVNATIANGTSTTEFSNSTQIIIPDHGPASPYPSSINVTGMGGNINNVTVTVKGVDHQWIADIALLLVGPNGQTVRL